MLEKKQELNRKRLSHGQRPEILVDITRMDIAGGFGQICTNFAPRLVKSQVEWANFIFLVKPERVGAFDGLAFDNLSDSTGHIRYAAVGDKEKVLSFLLPKVDLWHATDQDFRYRRHSQGCLQLMTVHDLNFLYEKSPAKQKRYLRRLQRRLDGSDYLTAISKFTANDVETHLHLRGKSIEVIPNGIEDIRFLKPSRPDFDNGQPFFFTIGQVRAKKNFHVLVAMMKDFPDHRLYICGDDRYPYAETVRAEIERHGLQDRVLMSGKIRMDEKVWLYAHCEAFLFPSFAEGFGLPVLEAMLFGKPVFASKATSLPEVCGPYAVLWDNYEPHYLSHSIRDGLERFFSHPEIIQEEISYALGFSYETYTQRYLDLYHRILFGEGFL